MNELGRSQSAFDKQGTINKRKKWAIVAAVSVIVLLAIAVGAGVAASGKKKHDSKSSNDKTGKGTTSAPAATAPKTPTTTKAASALTRPIQREMQLGGIRPADLTSFLKDLSARVSSAGIPGFAFEVPAKLPVSLNSFLMYMRDMYIVDLWRPLLDYLETKDISAMPMQDVARTVEAVYGMLTPKAVKKWGQLLAKGHDMGVGNYSSRAVTTLAAMQAKALTKKLRLPKYTVTKAAAAQYLTFATNSTPVPADLPKKLPGGGRRLAHAAQQIIGRRLAAGETEFTDLCIPVVFHVLQFQYTGDDGVPAFYPGVDLVGGYADAKNLIDVTNNFFQNEELALFKQPASPTKVQFRVEAVVQSPGEASYLGVTDEQWATCADDMDFMLNMAEAISGTYPPTKYINVIVCGDPGDGSGVLGYAFVPQGPQAEYDETDATQHIFLRTDEFFAVFNNNIDTFNRGATTLTHELGHHLGLFHPHPSAKRGQADCDDGDNLPDTPTTGVVSQQAYYSDLNGMCDTWRLEGTWPEAGYEGYTLGQMSSCEPATSIDPVFNLMEYTPTSCYSHFTPGQVVYLQTAIPFYRPQLYANTAGICPV